MCIRDRRRTLYTYCLAVEPNNREILTKLESESSTNIRCALLITRGSPMEYNAASYPDNPNRDMIVQMLKTWYKEYHEWQFPYSENALAMMFLVKTGLTRQEQTVFHHMLSVHTSTASADATNPLLNIDLKTCFSLLIKNFVTPQSNFDDPRKQLAHRSRGHFGNDQIIVIDCGYINFPRETEETYVHWVAHCKSGHHGFMQGDSVNGDYVFHSMGDDFAWKVFRFRRRRTKRGRPMRPQHTKGPRRGKNKFRPTLRRKARQRSAHLALPQAAQQTAWGAPA